jgi:hypothetical protein
MPVNYQLGKIYKIINNINNEIYVGSTCEPILARRLAGHIGTYKQYLKGKTRYISSYKIIEMGNYEIVLIENYPCENKDELHKRERHYIEKLECVNKFIPGRTNNEYYEANKEEKKIYQEANKDKIKLYHENYYETNKEKLKINYDNYYEKNKEKLKLKCKCICGEFYTFTNKTQHIRSLKHQYYINNIQQLFNNYKLLKQQINLILSNIPKNRIINLI